MQTLHLLSNFKVRTRKPMCNDIKSFKYKVSQLNVAQFLKINKVNSRNLY